MNERLDAALEYEAKGFSVIPVKRDKRPYIPWTEFQRRRAEPSEIRDWWRRWPSANVALVTGALSNLVVVDVDTCEGVQAIQKYIPDTIPKPTALTPSGGQHYFFRNPEEPIGNNIRLFPGCDFRGQGGYVVAPPSSNGKRAWQWIPGMSIFEIEPPPLPAAYIEYVSSKTREGVLGGGVGKDGKTTDNKRLHLTPNEFKKIPEGQRDHALYHLANAIFNRTISEEEVLQLLGLIAVHCCDPPFPLREIPAKIRSVLNRIESRERNFAQEVRDWVLTSSGFFLTSDVYSGLQLTSRREQKACVLALLRMVEEGLIEKYGERRGCYRRVERDCEVMDFLNASIETVSIRLPFNLHEMVEIMPGNIILLAGEVNAGKTAYLLNVIRDNMQSMETHYFNSEMGSSELRKRLSKFDMPLGQWRFKAWERSENFGDVIQSGKDKLNIIDFLEVYENFYEVGGRLAEIHKKLNGAIAVVALQKNPRTDLPLGGFRGLEKPRLAMAMANGELKIVKAKNWKHGINPNGRIIRFKILNGCRLIARGGWQ